MSSPHWFYQGQLGRNLDLFRLDFVFVSDERGSVINDNLQLIVNKEKKQNKTKEMNV